MIARQPPFAAIHRDRQPVTQSLLLSAILHHPSSFYFHPYPQSTLAHPKSTVDLGLGRLIRVENGLGLPLSSTCYQPVIRPENKGIKPNTSRYRPKNVPRLLLEIY